MHILFTSAASPTALALARVLAAQGHTIHAADHERVPGTSPARYSRAYTHFHRLTPTLCLAELWKDLSATIDLVVPFAPLPGHILESLRSRGANVVGETLVHNDWEFQDFVRETVMNRDGDEATEVVKVPSSFTVHSGRCVAEILSMREARFMLMPMPCYDFDDEDTLVDVASSKESESMSLVVSREMLNEKSVEAVKRLPMSEARPYRLIEVAEGGSFYAAHAFVHAGRIRTFVVTGGIAVARDFVVVSPGQPLYDVLYQFTSKLAQALEEWQTVAANHLSLTFHVLDKVKHGELVRRVTVISCKNEPHASLALLASVPELKRNLALAYTSSSLEEEDSGPVEFPASSKAPKAIYSAPLAVFEFARILLQARLWRRDWWWSLARMMMMCLVWVMNFQEEMWAVNDPKPAMCFWATTMVGRLLKSVGLDHIARRVANTQLGTGIIHRTATALGILRAIAFSFLALARYWLAVLMMPWVFTVRTALRVSSEGRKLIT